MRPNWHLALAREYNNLLEYTYINIYKAYTYMGVLLKNAL